MNKNEIKEALCELNKATGFRISLHDVNAEEICAAPAKIRAFCGRVQKSPEERALCERCDSSAYQRALSTGDTYSYKCRFGLTETVSPIYNFNKHVGFLMMGQTFECEEDRRTADEGLKALGVSESEREAVIADVPAVKGELAAAFAKILTIFAKYLTLSGAVYGKEEGIPEAAMRYIKENYSRKIQIKDICAKLGCSKTTLLSAFKAAYNVTVNAAITSVRLEAARKQLSAPGSSSINDVALAAGFSDQSYFCKVFSAEYGETPSEYKKRTEKQRGAELNSLPASCASDKGCKR